MSISSNKHKRPLRIAIIAAAVSTIAAVVFIVLLEKNNNRYVYDEQQYQKEEERFEKVLQQASDEELLIVLKYAIIHHYVPTYDVDPYFNVFAGVGSWHRTKMIYDKLSRRPDLLRKIYPNLGILRDYVNNVSSK